MANYSLKASYSTVQVLSPTLTQDVVYCTIQTVPSNVVASISVSQTAFSNNGANEELTAFADGIEQIMTSANVNAASGGQTIDASGLLADNVVFIVDYEPPGSSGTSITAEATVPVGLLSQSDPAIAEVTMQEADAIINGVYANLKNAAGG